MLVTLNGPVIWGSPPTSSVNGYLAALEAWFAAQPALTTALPGGLWYGDAPADRTAGPFCEYEDDVGQTNYTSFGIIEVHRTVFDFMALGKEQARLLGESFCSAFLALGALTPYCVASNVFAVVRVSGGVLDESTDHAPIGGNRLHRQQLPFDVWYSRPR